MSRGTRAGIAATALLAALAALPAAASADAVIASGPGASGVDAFGGTLVWSQNADNGRQQLMALRNGQVTSLHAAPSTKPYVSDIGPKPSGGLAAAYLACLGERCSIHLYDFETRTDRPIDVSRARCALIDAPSYYKGRIAFVGHRCAHRRNGVWTLVHKKLRHLGLGVGRGPSLPLNDRTDQQGSTIAIADGSSVFLGRARPSRRSTIVPVDEAGSGTAFGTREPILDGATLYTIGTETDRSGGPPSHTLEVRRLAGPLSVRPCRSRSLPLAADIAADNGSVYYTLNGNVVSHYAQLTPGSALRDSGPA